jgi:hypothetical protein
MYMALTYMYGAAVATANEATFQPGAAGTSQHAQEQQQQHHQQTQDDMMDLLERFKALAHDEREMIRVEVEAEIDF